MQLSVPKWLDRLWPGYRRRQEQRAIVAAEQIVREHRQAVKRRERLHRRMEEILQPVQEVLNEPAMPIAPKIGIIACAAYLALREDHVRRR